MTTTRFGRWLSLAVVGAGLSLTGLARAQDAPAEGEAPAAEPAAPEADAPADAKAPDADSRLVADAEAGGSPVENPGQAYRFVGLRYRGIIVPKFMMNLFGDGGATVELVIVPGGIGSVIQTIWLG